MRQFLPFPYFSCPSHKMWHPHNKDKQVDLFCDAKGAKQTTPTMGSAIGNSDFTFSDTQVYPQPSHKTLDISRLKLWTTEVVFMLGG